MPQTQILQAALKNGEGIVASNGAFTAFTGKRTGRSPGDRFIVDDAVTHDDVAWGKVNQALSSEAFTALWERVEAYLADKTVYSEDLAVGADPAYQVPVTVRAELAWHVQFCHNMFIREPSKSERPKWTILAAAKFKTDPGRDGVNSDAAVILNFTERKILVCGTEYAGEMKKAMFSVLNFLLPREDVLPMHCSANIGKDGDVALFFGLSGTGKTTLSADPDRLLIGDDEHGWSKDGVFNFEGGCYAKCINLSEKNEPMIFQAIRENTIMENVFLDAQGVPDYNDGSYSENSRACYPLEHISERVLENRGGQPNAVIFLCCDLYGVLPPVAKLSKEQAAYYFLSGYTALVGSTEVGQGSGIKSTFSTCFGAPFFPCEPKVYADLLIKRLNESAAPVYLVNTGWSGGAYGQGKRFSIPITRSVITAIVSGDIENQVFEKFPNFDFLIPKHLPGVQAELLDPRKTWIDQAAYQHSAAQLIKAFEENFLKYPYVDNAIKVAGPCLKTEDEEVIV